MERHVRRRWISLQDVFDEMEAEETERLARAAAGAGGDDGHEQRVQVGAGSGADVRRGTLLISR